MYKIREIGTDASGESGFLHSFLPGSHIFAEKMILNKTAVRKTFKKYGLQINVLSLHALEEYFDKVIAAIAEKGKEMGIKRINPENLNKIGELDD